MKFGQQFDYHKIPEWSDNYLDYVELKFLLNEFRKNFKKTKFQKRGSFAPKLSRMATAIFNKIVKNEPVEEAAKGRNRGKTICSKPQSDPNKIRETFLDDGEDDTNIVLTEIPASDSPQKNKEKFTAEFKEKVNAVNSFFLAELENQINKFIQLKAKLDNKKISFGGSAIVSRDSTSNENYKYSMSKENAERDELGYAVSWKRAISQLFNFTSWLHSFCIINSIACQKILKKYKKVMREQNFEVDQELDDYFKSLEFVTKLEDVIELRKKIKQFYADEMTHGDVNKATKEIDERMKGNRTKDKTIIAFNLGMIVTLISAFILLSFIPEKNLEKDNNILIFFPAFSFVYIIIFSFMGLAIIIKILQKYRINYIFIFEIDPKIRLGFNEIFRTALFLLNVWCILLFMTKASLNFDLFHSDFFIFPLLLLCLFLTFMLLPFHLFYYSFRKMILITMFKNIFPFGKNGVRFLDFMFGDVLTSLTRPFVSLSISLCLFACEKCRGENIRFDCTRNSTLALCLTLAPFIIRLFQCLNRYYYTRMAWPHLANALKYCGGITYNSLSFMYALYKMEYFYHFLISGIISNCYMLFWDIYMDWNLARSFKTNFFLRDNIIYPKWMYYGALVINALLRFTWLTSLPGVVLPMPDEIKIFVLSILEIYRRIQWSLFRIENENTNNPEKYRNILDIPPLPMQDS